MPQQPRSIRRLALGIFSIASASSHSSPSSPSPTSQASVFLAASTGFTLIALGVGLILPKKERKNEEIQ